MEKSSLFYNNIRDSKDWEMMLEIIYFNFSSPDFSSSGLSLLFKSKKKEKNSFIFQLKGSKEAVELTPIPSL